NGEPPPAFTAADLDGLAATPVESLNSDTDLAHILFTSGSTGVPKGVMVSHRSVLRFLEWAWKYFGISQSDRASQHSPLHFDLSTFDVFSTLGAGAELHLTPSGVNLLPHKMAQHIRKARLTQWFSVPSVLNLMAKLDVVRPGDFPDLRRVMWCGEVLPTPTLIHWMRRLPHARFTNLYGPTEATIASSYYTVPRCPTDERAPVPIGTPCDGEELMILDDEMRPVRDGEIGNLYIGGVGLSPGYWNDPDKTRSVFLPRPGAAGLDERLYRTGDLGRRGADGLMYFAGRTARSCAGGSSWPRPNRARERRASHRARCSLKARGRMSDRSVALERLGALFLQHFHVEVPSPDTDLLETGMLDSLQLVDLLLLIEEEFGQRISLQAIELDDLRTLARLAQLVGTSAASTPDARTVSTSREVR